MRAAGIALLAAALGAAPAGVAAQAAPAGPIHAAPLPAGSKRVPASADECAVWKRELAFARTVEAHDGAAFAAFLHSGTVFDAGSAEADHGQGWHDGLAGRLLPVGSGTANGPARPG